MADYSSWSELHLRVSQLRLDPQNPRLHPREVEPDQRTIIGDLLRHDDVLQLASRIASHGYFPTDSVVAIRAGKSRSYVVLEGNRRVAALQLLQNPALAPEEFKKRVNAISQRSAGRLPNKIRAIIAPDRTAARPLILDRHTAPGVKKWTPVAQARCIEKMVDDGFSVEEMAGEMGMSLSKFRRQLRTARLVRIITNLTLPQGVAELLDEPRGFTISTIQRICESPVGRKWLGYELDEDGSFKITTTPSTFRKALTRIVTDIATDSKLNTRTLNTDQEIADYLAGLKGEKPTKSQSSPTSAEKLAGSKTPPRTQARVKPRRRTTTAGTILPAGLECTLDVERIHLIIGEMKKLPPAKYPNASALLLRALLDMGVGDYLESKGLMDELIKKLKSTHPRDWMPSLDQMLKFLLDHPSPTALPLERSAIKALVPFVTERKKSQVSLDGLNGFAHNRFQQPSPEQLLSISVLVKPLLALILEKQ